MVVGEFLPYLFKGVGTDNYLAVSVQHVETSHCRFLIDADCLQPCWVLVNISPVNSVLFVDSFVMCNFTRAQWAATVVEHGDSLWFWIVWHRGSCWLSMHGLRVAAVGGLLLYQEIRLRKIMLFVLGIPNILDRNINLLPNGYQTGQPVLCWGRKIGLLPINADLRL